MSTFNKVQPVRKPTRTSIIASLPKALQPYAHSLNNHLLSKARRRADILGIPFAELLYHESQGCKYCTRCYAPKPATTEYFHLKTSTRDGLRSMCKPCQMLSQSEQRDPQEKTRPIVSKPTPPPQEPVAVRKAMEYRPPRVSSGRTVRYDPALHNAGRKIHVITYTPLEQIYDRNK
jgi:hypothetical protein